MEKKIQYSIMKSLANKQNCYFHKGVYALFQNTCFQPAVKLTNYRMLFLFCFPIPDNYLLIKLPLSLLGYR